jgi:hypothetical protein
MHWLWGSPRKRMNGQRRGIDLRAHVRLAAKVAEVGGEAVAEVDGGSREAAP